MIWRRLLVGAPIVMALLAAAWAIFHQVADTGAAKADQKTERQRAARVAEARADERTAAAVSSSISQHVARADDLSTEAVKATIKDLRDALDDVPPAAAGDPLPAAPVDGMRNALNAGIDRANRAGQAPAAGG